MSPAAASRLPLHAYTAGRVDVFLETERLVLRRFTMDDLEAIVELDRDPDVMRYISGGLATPREEIASDILPAWLGYYARFDSYGFWAAHAKRSGEFLGWFHFRPPPAHEPNDVELGYRLRKSAWGKGYATEGSRALIAHGFTIGRVQRVFASAMVVNTASWRVMEKAGMKFEGQLRDYELVKGAYQSLNLYSILKSDFHER